MQNFIYHSPTKVYFGRGYEKQIGALLAEHGFRKPLIVYGGGSIKRSGLYDTVVASLKEAGLSYAVLGGVQPNPCWRLQRRAFPFPRRTVRRPSGRRRRQRHRHGKSDRPRRPLRRRRLGFLVRQSRPVTGIPTAVILTIAAAGSETSESAVITNEDGMQKRGRNSIFNRPIFSIMNPELTCTLPAYQTACGAVDIMMHTLERYITLPRRGRHHRSNRGSGAQYRP